MALTEGSAERRVLHQQLATDLHTMGLQKTVELLKKQGVVERIMRQTNLMRTENPITLHEFLDQPRIKRRLAAASR